jgi:serine/threonine protein kinase
MELVTSLPKYLETNRLTREQVIKLGIDICTALDLCSKNGIIHRDIKDENIFISKDGIFKLGDFGIAKELSKTGKAASMRGTPLYMAPEVFRGEKYDAAVDIYSLGIVLYKLLNGGRMPFMPPYPQLIKFKDAEEALEKRISGEQLSPPAFAEQVLSSVILKACANKPEDRYFSATEMKQALEQIISSMCMEERTEKITPEKMMKTEQQTQIEKPTFHEGVRAKFLNTDDTIGSFQSAEACTSSFIVPARNIGESTIGITDAIEQRSQTNVENIDDLTYLENLGIKPERFKEIKHSNHRKYDVYYDLIKKE